MFFSSICVWIYDLFLSFSCITLSEAKIISVEVLLLFVSYIILSFSKIFLYHEEKMGFLFKAVKIQSFEFLHSFSWTNQFVAQIVRIQ